MLSKIKSLILIVTLSGCAAMPWTDTREDALRQEAGYLAGLVKKNKINKVQAADRLNIKRINLIGQNPYDDEVFAYYRHLAGERDRKRIDQDEAQSLMQKKLSEVRARYRQDPGKSGKTPVFTNFMMELYGLPSL
ncbi:conserved hypothetical protein [Sulfuricella denitrificans skB26]|uniref:Lipoprotein n=1 Tax=Sulfuricella denitrificans (strain DSM 22764 / NBRC 105220 / skB26) TaxID=1163617 RepID=S6B6M1_SULDS|nr:hypothetical protein [Sulfuricella denitrificans]BAN36147.1 conserved hypothetical protein [Sulfuricella denitrificans skB26]